MVPRKVSNATAIVITASVYGMLQVDPITPYRVISAGKKIWAIHLSMSYVLFENFIARPPYAFGLQERADEKAQIE